MPKNTSAEPPKTKKILDAVERVKHAAELVTRTASGEFEPTPRQFEVRSALWTHLRLSPQIKVEDLTPAKVRDMLRIDTRGLEDWWSQPGFVEWFLDGNLLLTKLEEAIHKTVALIHAELDSGECTLKDLNVTLKLLAEITDRMPKRWVKERFVDEEIMKMAPAEAERLALEFARSKGWSPPADAIDIEALPPASENDQ
jgi:hypothetical protein